MTKFFFDTNILIDILDESAEGHTASRYLLNKLAVAGNQLYISPTSFAITFYFLNKYYINKSKLNLLVKSFFTSFIFTREDTLIMKKVLSSSFTDLEDALQYYSAQDSGINIIITKNYFDFNNSTIPVYHPLQYISEFFL